ncbi:MAG: hypothetical protein HP491_09975 [Nitrospira sp.]|nr:hypothetical protein [Nitrospira sp.]MBH0183658.1 hypothetical protein [Nitrospira sp.]
MMNYVLDKPLNSSLAHVRRNDDGSCAVHHLEEHGRTVAPMTQGVIARGDQNLCETSPPDKIDQTDQMDQSTFVGEGPPVSQSG